MYRTDNLLIDLNSFTFKFGCLDSFSSSTLDVWYQIISIVFDTSQDFPTLFAKLPFPHWMNLYHDNFPPCLTLQNPRCLSLRFLPFSTSNVWTKIILHHVWRLCKIFKSHSFYLFYFSFLSLPDLINHLHQISQKIFFLRNSVCKQKVAVSM